MCVALVGGGRYVGRVFEWLDEHWSAAFDGRDPRGPPVPESIEERSSSPVQCLWRVVRVSIVYITLFPL